METGIRFQNSSIKTIRERSYLREAREFSFEYNIDEYIWHSAGCNERQDEMDYGR